MVDCQARHKPLHRTRQNFATKGGQLTLALRHLHGRLSRPIFTRESLLAGDMERHHFTPYVSRREGVCLSGMTLSRRAAVKVSSQSNTKSTTARRLDHSTFEEYCRQKWGWNRAYAG